MSKGVVGITCSRVVFDLMVKKSVEIMAIWIGEHGDTSRGAVIVESSIIVLCSARLFFCIHVVAVLQ